MTRNIFNVVEYATADMWGRHHLVELQQRMVSRRRFLRERIQTGPAQVPACERTHERRFVDQLAAGGVDQNCTALHCGKGVGVDEMFGGGRGRRMQAHDIALLDQLGEVDMAHAQLRLKRGGRTERVVINHLTFKPAKPSCQHFSNVAKTDQAYRLATDLKADLAHFRLQPTTLPHGAVNLCDSSVNPQHERNGQLGNRGGVGPCSDGERDASRPHSVHVDAVYTNAPLLNETKPMGPIKHGASDGRPTG